MSFQENVFLFFFASLANRGQLMSWKRILVLQYPYSPASARARSGGGNESNNRREAPATVAGDK